MERGEAGYCFACGGFPGGRLFRMDKRNKTQYGMSMEERK